MPATENLWWLFIWQLDLNMVQSPDAFFGVLSLGRDGGYGILRKNLSRTATGAS